MAHDFDLSLGDSRLPKGVAAIASRLPDFARAALLSLSWPDEKKIPLGRYGGSAPHPGVDAQRGGKQDPALSAAAQSLIPASAVKRAFALDDPREIVSQAGLGLFLWSETQYEPGAETDWLRQMQGPFGQWLIEAVAQSDASAQSQWATALAFRIMKRSPADSSAESAQLAIEQAMRLGRRSDFFAQAFSRAVFLKSHGAFDKPAAQAFAAGSDALRQFAQLLEAHPARPALFAEAFAFAPFCRELILHGRPPSAQEALGALRLIWAQSDQPQPQRAPVAFRSRRWPTGDAAREEAAREQIAALLEAAWPARAEWSWIFVDFASDVLAIGAQSRIAIEAAAASARGEIPLPPRNGVGAPNFMPWMSALRAMENNNLALLQAHARRAIATGRPLGRQLPVAQRHPNRPFFAARVPLCVDPRAPLAGWKTAASVRVPTPTLSLAAIALGNAAAFDLLVKLGAGEPSVRRFENWREKSLEPALKSADRGSMVFAADAQKRLAKSLALWESILLRKEALRAIKDSKRKELAATGQIFSATKISSADAPPGSANSLKRDAPSPSPSPSHPPVEKISAESQKPAKRRL